MLSMIKLYLRCCSIIQCMEFCLGQHWVLVDSQYSTLAWPAVELGMKCVLYKQSCISIRMRYKKKDMCFLVGMEISRSFRFEFGLYVNPKKKRFNPRITDLRFFAELQNTESSNILKVFDQKQKKISKEKKQYIPILF